MELSKDDILNCDDLKLKEVDIPQWSGSIFIKPMSGTGRDAFETQFVAARNKGLAAPKHIRSMLAVLTVCDSKGNLLFNSDKDVAKLGNKSGAALDLIFAEAQKINGLSDDDVDALAKN